MAAHPVSTTESNVGLAKVPDHRLDAPGRDVQSRRTSCTPRVSSSTSAGWSRGPARARGWATGSSAGIREVDAIVFVLRAFEDDDVPGGADPLERPAHRSSSSWPSPTWRPSSAQIDKRRKAAKQDKSLADEVAALEAAHAVLHDGTPHLPGRPRRRAREPLLRPYFLLTNKPVLAVVNVGEDELDRRRRRR